MHLFIMYVSQPVDARKGARNILVETQIWPAGRHDGDQPKKTTTAGSMFLHWLPVR